MRCAAHGVQRASQQRNIRIMGAIAAAVIVIAALEGVSALRWALLLTCIGVVLAAELLNTAIEILADQVEPAEDPSIRDVKDVAAGAVLILSAFATVIGLIILWPT